MVEWKADSDVSWNREYTIYYNTLKRRIYYR